MTEIATEAAPQQKPRRNKVAEQKAALRAELAALANKVPEFVNAGGVQTTRQWVAANERAAKVADGGMARMSRKQLEALTRRMKGEKVEEAA